MSKSPEAFRTISEVAERLGVANHVLRFWESRFSQIKPVKRAGGRRYYRPGDVALLSGIRHLLYDEGITIKAVQKILGQKGVKHVAGLAIDLPDQAAETPTVPQAKTPDNLTKSLTDDLSSEPNPVEKVKPVEAVQTEALDATASRETADLPRKQAPVEKTEPVEAVQSTMSFTTPTLANHPAFDPDFRHKPEYTAEQMTKINYLYNRLSVLRSNMQLSLNSN